MPLLLISISSVSWYAWPDDSWEADGQMTLPEMSLTVPPEPVELNWLNGSEIEPSG